MSSRVLVGTIIVVLILIGGFALLRGSSSQPGNSTIPQTNNTPPTTSAQPSMSEMTMTPSPSQQASTTPAADQTIKIANFSFTPSTMTVKVGTTVTWTNQDSVGHSATADDGSFDTGVLAQGKSGSFTFTKAGTYAYHCSVHPNMHGTIIVQ